MGECFKREKERTRKENARVAKEAQVKFEAARQAEKLVMEKAGTKTL